MAIWRLGMAVIEGRERHIVGGVDTHKDLHVAAVVDEQDRIELWPKVGEGVNRGRRHIVGVFEPPLLHRRSDMPCPTIPLSN
jgi:hypothetical protein